MVILGVRLEVTLETGNALGEERDLNFGRSGVVFAALPRADNFRLLCCRDQVFRLLVSGIDKAFGNPPQLCRVGASIDRSMRI